MAEKSIDDWIELLTDRSKDGEFGEYFHREECAELLEFLNELKEIRKGDYRSGIAKAIYDRGYKSGWNSCISDRADGWMVDYI